MDRRRFITSAALSSLGLFALVGCSNTSQNAASSDNADIKYEQPEIPKAQPDPEHMFGVDLNINMDTIDDYLNRDDVVYRDMRLFDDPADYEAIGGNSKLSMALPGFSVVPLPYLATLSELPVSGAYDGDRLFEVEWGDGIEILSVTPNYTQSMQILEELFPKDKPIFLMCGGAGYAGMTRSLLIFLGWDPDMVYNIGGQWEYEGPNLVQIISYADPEKPEYYLWRLDMPTIDFSLLYPIE